MRKPSGNALWTSWTAKDNLTDMCEHIRKFMTMKKNKDTIMKAYISNLQEG